MWSTEIKHTKTLYRACAFATMEALAKQESEVYDHAREDSVFSDVNLLFTSRQCILDINLIFTA